MAYARGGKESYPGGVPITRSISLGFVKLADYLCGLRGMGSRRSPRFILGDTHLVGSTCPGS